MSDVIAIYQEEVNKINNVTDLVASLIYQPISTAISSHFRKNGGNALGFDDRDGPLNCTYFLQFIYRLLTGTSDKHCSFLDRH